MFKIFKKKSKVNIASVPKHVAIIMDGNSRWAKKRGLPKKAGHLEGVKRIEDVLEVAKKYGIETVTLYAFSTENWKRDDDEISYLFKLIHKFYEDHFDRMIKNEIAFKMIGEKSRIPQETIDLINKMEIETKDFKKSTLIVALNYGGRDEIIRAIKKIDPKEINEIDENKFSKLLDTPYDNVDLMIRTSGEKRLSNYLLWQNAYAEFIFTDVEWPSYGENEFEKSLLEYQKRKRRFGGR